MPAVLSSHHDDQAAQQSYQSEPPAVACSAENIPATSMEATTSPTSWPESTLSADHPLSTDRHVIPAETPAEAESSDSGTRFSADLSPRPATQIKSDDDDESIEAYMARLLKRVRGDAIADAFVAPQAAMQAEPVTTRPSVAEQSVEPTCAAPAEPQEFLPRKAPPGQSIDVAAMRELAVQSTRHAIHHSSQLRYQRKSLATTLGACALMGLSVGLFGWGFDTGNLLAWSGSGVCLLGAVYLMTRRMKLLRTAKTG